VTPVAADALDELLAALAEGDTRNPTAATRDTVVHQAFATRSPGRPVHELPAISAREVLARTVASFDAVASSLASRDWAVPVLRDLDAQGLVGHLIGVEEAFQEALSGAPPAPGGHVEATTGAVFAQRGAAPATTFARWRDATNRTLGMLDGRDPTETVELFGIPLPLDAMLIIRAFELWTHEEDLLRALERPLRDPEVERLQRMVDLVVDFLPLVLPPADPADAPVRLVLIGDAGGTFDVGHPQPFAAAPCARIVAESVAFCRLIANRASPDTVALSLSGDEPLARELLALAPSLALD
jgi:uncharacterized protein (TIGR03083 family)